MLLRRLSMILLLFGVAYCAAQNTKENADFKLALNLFNDKLYDLSLEQFKQFISTYPSSPQSIESKFYIALADRALKKNDDARAAFQNFALTYPEHPKAPDAWWNVGEMYSEGKKFGRCLGVRTHQSLPAKKQIGAQGIVDRKRVLRTRRRH